MAQQRHVVVLLMLACLFTSSYSYQFTVGGKDGWVPNPSVDYNTWSQHMRFIINDSVLFKYKQGADSVLEVSKDDYDKCNTGNPIKKMEDGNSIFTLDRSGPFYFISGNKDNCDKGQKLQIIVISVRNQGKPPQTPAPGVAPPSNGSTTPSPTGSPPSTGGSSPAASPPKGSSTPGTPSAPSANAPAGSSTPGASSPNGAPVSTPAGKSPTSSPTPSGSPASPPAPATGGSVAPAMPPVANGPSTSTPGSSSPMAGGPSSGIGIAPEAAGPSGSGIAPEAGGPAGFMSPEPSAGGPLAGGPSAGAPGSSASGPGGSNTPADINSPAGAPENPNSFAVKAFTPSIVLVSAVSLVLTVALGEFIILP
uniref:Putative early nodulin-like protein 2-like n=1 Tax=Solanum chacoense TaxID=4108 RepID=A0A0V0ICY7_SOLCH